MTKAIGDIIDRIQGAANALRGVRAKLTRQPPPPGIPSTDVQPPQIPPEISQEDYDHAKKVVADLKAQVDALEAEVSRESQVPGEEVLAKQKSAAEAQHQASAHQNKK